MGLFSVHTLRALMVVAAAGVAATSSATHADSVIREYHPSGRGDIGLRYIVARPDDSDRRKLPVWILQTGDGEIMQSFQPSAYAFLARKLANRYDVMVVWPELRREYYSGKPKRFCQLDYFHRIDDLNALTAIVRGFKGIHLGRLFYIGYSGGADVATIAANRRSDIAAVATLGGGLIDLMGYLKDTNDTSWVAERMANECVSGHYNERSGLFWKQFLNTHLYEEILKSRIPYLALLGGDDKEMMPEVHRPYARELRRQKSDFVFGVIPGLGHIPISIGNILNVYEPWDRISSWTERAPSTAKASD
jgi:hypothetical protein